MKDRYKKILELCKDKISVNEIIDYFDVSASTIRRDLVDLEDMGLIIRNYGTVMINPDQSIEASNEYKALYMAKEKDLIARYAASLIKSEDIVYIDAGTTTSRIIEYISAKNIMIVTQSMDCLEQAKERNFKVFMNSGYYKRRTNALVSNETIKDLEKMSFNIAFMAGNGVHPLTGFTCPDEIESLMKSTVISRALKSYICIDSTKFNKFTASKFAELRKAHVITDRKIKDFDYSVFDEVVFVNNLNSHKEKKK